MFSLGLLVHLGRGRGHPSQFLGQGYPASPSPSQNKDGVPLPSPMARTKTGIPHSPSQDQDRGTPSSPTGHTMGRIRRGRYDSCVFTQGGLSCLYCKCIPIKTGTPGGSVLLKNFTILHPKNKNGKEGEFRVLIGKVNGK